MQISSKKGSMVLDFYPIKDYNDNIVEGKFLRILSFMGQTQTKRIVNEAQMNEEILDRVSNYNYNVTDNLLNLPQFHNVGGAL